MKQTYLYQLFKANKLLFVVVCFHIIASLVVMPTVLSNHRTVINTSFIPAWGMFSGKIYPGNSYTVLDIKINDKPYPFSINHSYNFGTICNSIYNYRSIKNHSYTSNQYYKERFERFGPFILNNLYNDTTNIDNYKNWLFKFVENNIQHPVKSIKIDEVEIKYNNYHEAVEIGRKNLFDE